MSVRHVEQFYGLPVRTFPPYAHPEELPDPDAVAWRFQCGPYATDEDVEVCWRRFTESVELEKVRAVILGQPWYDADGGGGERFLTELAYRLTALEAVFLGDLEEDEAMVSWIGQSDLGPFLAAFPGLRELHVRGGQGLAFPVTGHEGLRVLRVESGGLPPEAAEQIAAAELPALERLELWLGDEDYGGGTTVAQLAPLLAGTGKQNLRHLGVQNSPLQDEFAAAFATAPVVERLASLSLSMGTLSDTGAEALLGGRPLTHLKELDLSHHFLSHAMMLRIWTQLEPTGVRVNLIGRQEAEDYSDVDYMADDADGRYIAVAE
ncbi:STM4015 family protein [Streptomyces corynorhini]|uniref:Leucine-rich repeat domain-containing protein n=1 Tax=Streptomyces corynorhini TaxID=2282652 RepID=A0A370B844_9ACTN|nr:STM4015 family protein [Streptomyces corynorhini]RDG36822.1 leucine-rich repeat domain-containing protein [Streptomyces corynorhini]